MSEGEISHESESNDDQKIIDPKEQARLAALAKLKTAKKNYQFDPNEGSFDDASEMPEDQAKTPHWTDLVDG